MFIERGWNDQAVKEVEETGSEASTGNKHPPSNTLAEEVA